MVQRLGINEPGRTVVFANIKNGRIERVWEDDDDVAEIETRDQVYAYELINYDDKSVVVEINFFK